MADDKTLKILLQVKSDTADLKKVVDGLKGIKPAADEAAKSGFGLKQAFEFAGANEVLHRLVETLKQIPEQFVEAIKQGVEFNAELQKVQTSIAGMFRQQAPDTFPTFEAAKKAAGETIELLKAKANELGIAYTDMFASYEHAQALLTAGGIHNVQQQIDTIALLNRAMQALGVASNAAARDIGDLLQGGGKAAQTLGVPRLAAAVHMQTDEFLQWIEAQKEAGTLAEGLQVKFSGLAASMTASGQTFNAQVNRMENAIFDLKVELAGPIMEPLTEAIESFAATMRSADAKEWATTLGNFIKDFVLYTLVAVHGWAEIYKSISNLDALLLRILPGAKAFASLLGAVVGPPAESFNLDAFMAEALNLKREKGNQLLDTGVIKLTEQTKQLQLQQEIEDQLNLSLARASGDTEVIAEQQAQTAADKVVATMKEKGQTQLFINGQMLTEDQIWKAIYDATYQQAIALAANKNTHNEINDLLREESALLQNNRLQQQLIQENPNLSPDQKVSRMIPLLIQERAELLKSLQAWQAYLAAQKGTDPETLSNIQRAIDKIREIGGQYQLLGLKVQSISRGVTGELKKWADSFGTSAHQIGDAITGSINQALEATNQLLIDAAFRTSDWRQTVVGLEKSLLNMFLTMLERMIIQQAMSLLFQQTATQGSVAAGAEILGAHAAPAAAVSISSYGAAAVIGEVLALAAIVAIMAALGGGFARGGRTGRGRRLATVGEEGEEFVFTHQATEKIGIANLYSMMHAAEAAPHFGEGGRLEAPDLPPERDYPGEYGPNVNWERPNTGNPVSSSRQTRTLRKSIVQTFRAPASLPAHRSCPQTSSRGAAVVELRAAWQSFPARATFDPAATLLRSSFAFFAFRIPPPLARYPFCGTAPANEINDAFAGHYDAGATRRVVDLLLRYDDLPFNNKTEEMSDRTAENFRKLMQRE